MAEYIDRKDAIEAVKHAWAKGLAPTQYIEIIPTADVAPVRHGEWLGFYGDYSNAECSQCGYQFEVIWEDAENVGDSMRKSMFDEFRKCYHYCPNCGAKMDGGTDNG